MKIEDAFKNINTVFVDTAPVIYFVERNRTYHSIASAIFERVDDDLLTMVTSPITLAECLVLPYRSKQAHVQKLFTRLITSGPNTLFINIDKQIGIKASQLRATYNLKLPDALQAAVALETGCDALLTNDIGFKKVTELNTIIIHELVLPPTR